MEIKTKYGIGQPVWVLRNCKATRIEINAILITEKGVEYGESRYSVMTPEEECFSSKEDLGRYVMS